MPAQLDTSKDQFRRLLVLIAVATVDMIGGAMVFPLIPFYALKLHASPTTIGMIIASFFVAQLISAPVWGRVSDHYGRRPALLIGLSASAAAFTVFGFANAIWLLFLCRIVQGLGGGTTGVVQAYIGDTVPPEDRARSLGCLSSVLALYLSAHFGITEKTIGYVFLYVGIFSVLMRSTLIGPIVDRIGEPWSIRSGAGLLILGLLAYPMAPN